MNINPNMKEYAQKETVYHCFDDDSLDEWLQTHDDCPVCKAPVHSLVTMDLILA